MIYLLELFINVIFIYFTPLPYELYIKSNRNGNLAYAGISLALIHSQNIFWTSNLILLGTLYYKNNNNYFINFLFFFLCIFLYLLSLTKIINMMHYFDIKNINL